MVIRTDPAGYLQYFNMFCPRFRFSFAGTELHKDAFNKFVKLWQQYIYKGAILFISFHLRVLRFGGMESGCPGCSCSLRSTAKYVQNADSWSCWVSS